MMTANTFKNYLLISGLCLLTASPSYAILDKIIGTGGTTTEEANDAPPRIPRDTKGSNMRLACGTSVTTPVGPGTGTSVRIWG